MFKEIIYNKELHTELSNFTKPGKNHFISEAEGKALLEEKKAVISRLQHLMYAEGSYALLVIIQAMDAGGKDGITKHVFAGINPLGCRVKSFKAPSQEELAHDYLWRCVKELPERGMIGVFNRSYYEEVLIVRIHPQILEKQNLPNYRADLHNNPDFWQKRFKEIKNFEKYLFNNGIIPVKIFLNISKEEQKNRFLSRITKASKKWKFHYGDIEERQKWDTYMKYYLEMFEATSTEKIPWHIIPADNKLVSRLIVADIIIDKLKTLNPKYPELSSGKEKELAKALNKLEGEDPLTK